MSIPCVIFIKALRRLSFMIKKSNLSKLLVSSILGIFTVYFFAFAQVSTTTNSLNTENIPGGPVNVNVNSLEKNSEGVPIVNPEQVLTEADLQVLQTNYEILNPNVGDISVQSNADGTMEISVTYKHPGDFLGIIPSNYSTITTIESSLNNIPIIDSQLSIWSSLIANKNFNRERVISRLNNNQTIRNEMLVNISPQSTARVIEATISELDQNELESANF